MEKQSKEKIVARIRSLMNIYGVTVDDLMGVGAEKEKRLAAEIGDDDVFGGMAVDEDFFKRYKDEDITPINESTENTSEGNESTQSDMDMFVDQSIVDDDFGGK